MIWFVFLIFADKMVYRSSSQCVLHFVEVLVYLQLTHRSSSDLPFHLVFSLVIILCCVRW